jgi:IPT/TIG domain-containing protein
MSKLSKSLRGLGLQVILACLVTALVGCPGVVVPVINSATPNVVPATTVDTVITFRGRNFQNGATATFTSADGTTVSATVATTFTDSTTVRCTAPKSTLVSANLPVSVTVANPDGNISNAVSVTYTPPPDVTTVTPVEAPATIATALTLAGQNFSGPAEVRFRRPDTSIIGTQSATIVSSNAIQVTSPVDNTLTADTLVTVEVINNDDQISAKVVKAAGSMTYLAPPTATAITPGSSALDTIPASTGTSVTITGTNFETGMTVSFDLPVSGATAATNVVVVNATTLTCDAPAEPTLTADATANVTVTAPDGQSSAALVSYYSAPPIVSLMTPAELPVSVEFPFTVTGTGFKAGAVVSFDLPTAGPTAAVAPVNILATVITGTSPIEPAGVAAPTVITVTVTNPDGQADSTTCTYWPPPLVNAAATPNPTPTVNLTSTIKIPNLQISGDLFRAGTIVTFRDSILTRIEDAATTVSGTGATAGGAVLTCATPTIDVPSPPNPRGPRLLADEAGTLLIVGPQGQTAISRRQS